MTTPAIDYTWDDTGGLTNGGLSAMKQSGNWFYYLADGLGSTMAVVDSSGNSQKSYEYDVYGEVTGGSGSLANEFDFAGQQTDPTGLQYLRARYYDPATGVFLSREPLERAPRWMGNPFGYAAGNPALMVDPDGLRPVDADGCQVSNPACARQPDNPRTGQEYTCSAAGCGWDFAWNFVGESLKSHGNGVFSWMVWTLTDGGELLLGRCSYSPQRGRQCSPDAEPLPSPLELARSCAQNTDCGFALLQVVAVAVAVSSPPGSGTAVAVAIVAEGVSIWVWLEQR